jgi:hypothetical protein
VLQAWHAKTLTSDQQETREREIKAIALVMQMTSPRMINESTRVDSIAYSDGVLRISYTLVDITKSDIDTDNYVRALKEVAVLQSCTNPTLGPYIQSGLIMAYLTRDAGGAVIAESRVSKADCR